MRWVISQAVVSVSVPHSPLTHKAVYFTLKNLVLLPPRRAGIFDGTGYLQVRSGL